MSLPGVTRRRPCWEKAPICSTPGCSRETWNGQQGDFCCRACKCQNGPYHTEDCERLFKARQERKAWKDDLVKGEFVMRNGEKVQIINIDRKDLGEDGSPPSYTVRTEDGREIGTERNRLQKIPLGGVAELPYDAPDRDAQPAAGIDAALGSAFNTRGARNGNDQQAPRTAAPTKSAPTTAAPTKSAPTTAAPTKSAPTTAAPTKSAPTTAAPTKSAPTTAAPTKSANKFAMVSQYQGRYFLQPDGGDPSRAANGSYSFDPKNGEVQDRGTGQVVGTFSCEPISTGPIPAASIVADARTNIPCIQIEDSEIMAEIQKISNAGAIFVLPSQLNGAEYPSHTAIVDKLDSYKYDNTGGPRGQLAVHPAPGQFVIDNAANDRRPTGINAVDEILRRTRETGFNFQLLNGYLAVPKLNGQDMSRAIQIVRQHLHSLRLLAMRDVPASGLTPDKRAFATTNHKVSLVYASAVPVQAYMNAGVNPEQQAFQVQVAEAVLVAQYYGALKLAAQRPTNTTIFLMPLGGGVFKNPWESIAAGMARAVEMLTEPERARLNIKALTYRGNPVESDTLSKLLRMHGKLKAQPPAPAPSPPRAPTSAPSAPAQRAPTLVLPVGAASPPDTTPLTSARSHADMARRWDTTPLNSACSPVSTCSPRMHQPFPAGTMPSDSPVVNDWRRHSYSAPAWPSESPLHSPVNFGQTPAAFVRSRSASVPDLNKSPRHAGTPPARDASGLLQSPQFFADLIGNEEAPHISQACMICGSSRVRSEGSWFCTSCGRLAEMQAQGQHSPRSPRFNHYSRSQPEAGVQQPPCFGRQPSPLAAQQASLWRSPSQPEFPTQAYAYSPRNPNATATFANQSMQAQRGLPSATSPQNMFTAAFSPTAAYGWDRGVMLGGQNTQTFRGTSPALSPRSRDSPTASFFQPWTAHDNRGAFATQGESPRFSNHSSHTWAAPYHQSAHMAGISYSTPHVPPANFGGHPSPAPESVRGDPTSTPLASRSSHTPQFGHIAQFGLTRSAADAQSIPSSAAEHQNQQARYAAEAHSIPSSAAEHQKIRAYQAQSQSHVPHFGHPSSAAEAHSMRASQAQSQTLSPQHRGRDGLASAREPRQVPAPAANRSHSQENGKNYPTLLGGLSPTHKHTRVKSCPFGKDADKTPIPQTAKFGLRLPVEKHVRFRSKKSLYNDFTPYAYVYGRNPTTFDFDAYGNMLPTGNLSPQAFRKTSSRRRSGSPTRRSGSPTRPGVLSSVRSTSSPPSRADIVMANATFSARSRSVSDAEWKHGYRTAHR